MPARELETEEDEERFIGRPCYVFNPAMRPNLNDTRCAHCRFYLTAQCPHIDEFLDDVEDLSPE
jgi:ferredoxin-thioredoxin reductase catalytic subunit